MTQILQVNFKFNIPREQYEEIVVPMGQDFADVPGCLWKIWLMNEKDSEELFVRLIQPALKELSPPDENATKN